MKSYLQWLQNSEFDVSCGICKESLEIGKTIRLCCLDVFHLDCLEGFCGNLPSNTAIAGFGCPICKVGLLMGDTAGAGILPVLGYCWSSFNPTLLL